MVIFVILLFIADFILTGFGTCYLWNNIATSILGLGTITFVQGYLISMLISWFKGIVHNKSDLKTAEDYAKYLFADIFVSLMWLGIAWVLMCFI